MDRDPVFTLDVRGMLAHAGVQPVRLPRIEENTLGSGGLSGVNVSRNSYIPCKF